MKDEFFKRFRNCSFNILKNVAIRCAMRMLDKILNMEQNLTEGIIKYLEIVI